MSLINTVNSFMSGRVTSSDSVNSFSRWPTHYSSSLQDFSSAHEAAAALDAGHSLVWRDQHADYRVYREGDKIVLDRRVRQPSNSGFSSPNWEQVGRFNPSPAQPLIRQSPDGQSNYLSFFNNTSGQPNPVYQLSVNRGSWNVVNPHVNSLAGQPSSSNSSSLNRKASPWGEHHLRSTKELGLSNGWSPVYLDFLR